MGHIQDIIKYMKKYVIIITHTEAKQEVRETINSVANDCDGVVLVCDRNESVADLCKEYDNVISFNINKGLEGRLTSTARNFGLRIIESFWKPEDDDAIIYMDGDRKLTRGSLNAVKPAHDVELIKLENDYRKEMHYSERYGEINNGFNSNGLIFKYSAIKKLKEHFGFVFPEEVQDVWGIEDRCLGDMCFHLNLSAEYNFNVTQKGTYERTEISNPVFYKRLCFSIKKYKLDLPFNPN